MNDNNINVANMFRRESVKWYLEFGRLLLLKRLKITGLGFYSLITRLTIASDSLNHKASKQITSVTAAMPEQLQFSWQWPPNCV